MTLFRYDSWGRRIPPSDRPHWSVWALVVAAVIVATAMAGDVWQAVRVVAGCGFVLVAGAWIAGCFKERK